MLLFFVLCVAATGLAACKGHSDRKLTIEEYLKDRHYFFPENNGHTLEISNPDGTAEFTNSKKPCREEKAAQEATIYDDADKKPFVIAQHEIKERKLPGGGEMTYEPTSQSKRVEVIVTPPINGEPQLWINRNIVPYDTEGSFEMRETRYFENPKTGESTPTYIQSVVYTVESIGDEGDKHIYVCPTTIICPKDARYLCHKP